MRIKAWIAECRKPARWASWYQTLWSKLLLTACASFLPLALATLQDMQPQMENGRPASSMFNLTMGIGRFAAVGTACIGLLVLLAAVVVFLEWLGTPVSRRGRDE